jgi:hypothetical protein
MMWTIQRTKSDYPCTLITSEHEKRKKKKKKQKKQKNKKKRQSYTFAM